MLRTLFTLPVLFQLGVTAGVLLLLFPLGRLAYALHRRIIRRLELPQRVVAILSRARAVLLEPPLDPGAEDLAGGLIEGLGRVGGPLVAYGLMCLGAWFVRRFLGAPPGILRAVAPAFLVFAAYGVVAAWTRALVSEKAAALLVGRVLRPMTWLVAAIVVIAGVGPLVALFQGTFLTVAGAEISLGRVLLALFLIVVFQRLAGSLKRLVREGIARSPKRMNPALGNTLGTFVGYLVTCVGLFLAVNTLGFSLTSLTVILGALTVGIGFGLQSIINNFVSGIILLVEQTIVPGDIVELEGEMCTVQDIRIRSTTVTTLRNIELRVPNSYFLENIVKSYTGRDPRTATSIAVGVSYDVHPRRAEKALLRAAERCELVLADPAPEVFFIDFGASSLNFRLRVWVAEPRLLPWAESALRFAVWEALDEAGIEIPFPQRDLHLRGGWPSLSGPDSTAPGHDEERTFPEGGTTDGRVR
jgi:small-conductance mechanosensitive channel